jgi:hypothetical protein
MCNTTQLDRHSVDRKVSIYGSCVPGEGGDNDWIVEWDKWDGVIKDFNVREYDHAKVLQLSRASVESRSPILRPTRKRHIRIVFQSEVVPPDAVGVGIRYRSERETIEGEKK